MGVPLLGCPGQEVKGINGDRINGLVISPTYKWGIYIYIYICAVYIGVIVITY